ncbi:MAG: PSD1 and planctomycete cytochrome C domain-containing protein, partial [Armatimonadota bacterium]
EAGKAANRILRDRCLACHTGAAASGKLDLSSRAGLLRGGASGAVLDRVDPSKGRFLKAVRHEGLRMPPQGRIPQAEIDILAKWVVAGVPFPANASSPVATRKGPPVVDDAARRFWSFRPVARPMVPSVRSSAWVRNPIDAFVLGRLEKAGLRPAPEASRTALLRRVAYDLTGLPPTVEETEAFLADRRPDAYERVVDRLLASPRYGERWARRWLDLVRYAETNSFERDGDKPEVWRYRDWVVEALNADMPYDRFLTLQLAGDEWPGAGKDGLIATGYYRLGQWDDEPVDPLQAKYDELDDIVTTTSQTMLGLTVNCARCHDHKIDPIPTADYYRLVAFFDNINRYGLRGHESVVERSLRPISDDAEKERHRRESEAWRERLRAIDAELAATERVVQPTFQPVEKQEFRDEFKRPGLLRLRVPSVLSPERFARYEEVFKEREAVRRTPPRGLEMALCVTEPGPVAPVTRILMRGNSSSPGAPVQPGTPSVLSVLEPPIDPVPTATTTGLRSEFARWVTSPANPLTARVMANRLFQFHFGRGIVRSSSNFGNMGTPPTHPELLDWLASEFVARGWSLKRMHRLMVTSSTYRMASSANKLALKKDPENDLLWRFDMRRLEAEEVRDSILAVCGNLNPAMGGPSVFAPIPDEVLAGQSVPGAGWGTSSPEEAARRTIYVKIKRSLVLPILASFDGADTDFTCPVRNATVVPTQALSLLNSKFVNEQAGILARNARAAAPDRSNRVRWILRRVLQRNPNAKELARGIRLIEDLVARDRMDEDAATTSFCLVALNLNEFLYLD